jgi:hypothetical protein
MKGFMKANGSNWSLNKKQRPELKRVDTDFHKLSFDDLTYKFSTSLTNGLDPLVAQQLLLKNGFNRIKQCKQNPFLKAMSYFFTG